MSINFIFSKGSDETRNWRTKRHNKEIMINETDGIFDELFESFLQNYQKILKNQLEEVNLVLIASIYCIIIFKK